MPRSEPTRERDAWIEHVSRFHPGVSLMVTPSSPIEGCWTVTIPHAGELHIDGDGFTVRADLDRNQPTIGATP